MKKIIGVIVVLAIIVGITAYLNKEQLKDKIDMQKNAVISICVDGEEVKKVSMDEIIKLGEKDFNANLKTNGKAPIEKTYTGVPLANVLEACNIDLSDKNQVIIKAVDGYTSALKVDEVKDKDNVYLAYKEEGEYLGNREDGGSGPYKVIIAKDQFSQRWCKFATEVNVK